MLNKIRNSKNTNIIIVLWLIISLISPLCFITPVEAAPVYVKSGDSVFITHNDTFIKVTPHTLTSSGWVTVDFSTKKFSGNVDVSFGFNGVDQVKTVKSESWQTYDKDDGKGKKTAVTDWVLSSNQKIQETKDYAGAKKWESTKHPKTIEKDKLYSVRFWVDLPFSGLNKISGKYNVAIKPSTLTIEQAIVQNQIAILDPWYDSSWGYRKQFTVTGSTLGAQTNYQVKFNIMYGAGADMIGLNREPATGTYAMDAGSGVNTIVDPTTGFTSVVDDYYNGCTFYNVNRALSGTITDYVGATKTATTTTIALQASGDTYYITGRVPTIYMDSKCQTDFDDIRFTKSDGATLLDSWLESYTASTIAAIWVEFDSLPVSPSTATFYIYYGNSTVASNWSGANTFIFFDDFPGVALDTTTKWTLSNAPTVVVAGGIVTLTSSADAWRGIISQSTYGTGKRWRSRGSLVVAANAYDMLGVADGPNPNTNGVSLYYGGAVSNQFYTARAAATTGVALAGEDANNHVYEITWETSIAKGFKDNVPLAEITTNIPLINLYVAAGVYDNPLAQTTMDWVFLAKYIPLEPLVTAYGAIETTGGLASVLQINNAKVFSSYLESGDWLITCLYLNKYEPYYTNAADVQSLFYIQLYDVAGTTLLAQTKCPEWGYKPGAIYLSAAQVSSLEWGLAYIVRVYGDFTGNPYVTYTLTPADWLGADLTRLDSWIRSTAGLMEAFYGATLTTYVTGKGLVLNENGGATFNTCIPACSQQRPGCFQIVTVTPGYTQATFTQGYSPGTWQILLGPTITSAFTNFGSPLALQGDQVGALLGFGFYVVVAALCFPAGSAIAAISVPSVILVAVWYVGLIPMAAMGFILAIMAFFTLYQFWWLKAG